MELLLTIGLVIVIAVIIMIAKNPKKLDVNNDGKIDVKDIQVAANVLAKAADVDGDGRISVQDAKAAIRKTQTQVAAKVQTGKPRGRKPAQKKG
jgi:hypothetical protein